MEADHYALCQWAQAGGQQVFEAGLPFASGWEEVLNSCDVMQKGIAPFPNQAGTLDKADGKC